jgi:putative transcriptional regulator
VSNGMNINKNRLNIIMASKGLNFIKLANLSKVSRVTLSYINNGKACRPDIVYKIATALNVDVTELIDK